MFKFLVMIPWATASPKIAKVTYHTAKCQYYISIGLQVLQINILQQDWSVFYAQLSSFDSLPHTTPNMQI